MRRLNLLGLVGVVALSASGAHGDTPPAAAALSGGAAGQSGAASYPAAFFADARPGNAFDMIQRLPGFVFDGGAQVRGFAGAAGNVLIDGERPTTKQDDLGQILRRIPASQVERIDLIRGGAPGIDMQGRTVIANVVRRKGGGAQAVMSLSDNNALRDGRNAPGVRLEWTERLDGKSLEASLTSGQFIDNGVGPGPHVQRDATGAVVYVADIAARAGGQQNSATAAFETPLAGGKFRVNGLIYDDYYLDREADRNSVPTGGDDTFQDRPTTDKAELGLHYSRDMGAGTSLETLAIQQVQRRTDSSRYIALGDYEDFTETDRLSESIVRATLRYVRTPHLSFAVAAEGAYNVQRTATGYYVNYVDQSLPALVREAEQRAEVAVSATWSPSPRYALEAGVRTEASTIRASGDIASEGKTLIYPKPRLVFTWSPDKDDQLRLRAEREVGQLDFAAFAASSSLNAGGVHLGNPGLLPQDAWVAEAAYERRFWSGGDATVTMRHSAINDAVDRTIGSVAATTPPYAVTYFDQPGNIGQAREDDLVVNVTLPLDRLWIEHGLIRATGTWRRTEATDPATLAPRPLTQIRPREADIHFTQDLNGLKSTWGVDGFAPWTETYYRFDEIDTYHWGAYYVLFFEYKPMPKFSLRTEFADNSSGGFDRALAYYAGSRAQYPSPYLVDSRAQKLGPTLYVRLRKSFG